MGVLESAFPEMLGVSMSEVLTRGTESLLTTLGTRCSAGEFGGTVSPSNEFLVAMHPHLEFVQHWKLSSPIFTLFPVNTTSLCWEISADSAVFFSLFQRFITCIISEIKFYHSQRLG